ncbi:hypothetical protein EXIGLDRAFT_458640 [Exidia glandulosa HHB12029]|uniref:Uncharacterized protein n=1 Tax=Exidia glandulosa HHB12029 TaxID=1314781 RepID=A0A165PPM8_EXIGL|nr:hypothetical protein EXIGLDRAFT_458640 [Exidia glandulosa HHB12029]
MRHATQPELSLVDDHVTARSTRRLTCRHVFFPRSPQRESRRCYASSPSPTPLATGMMLYLSIFATSEASAPMRQFFPPRSLTSFTRPMLSVLLSLVSLY